VDDPRLAFWHSFEPGVASFGLDGAITGLGLAVFGARFALLDEPERLNQVKRLLGQLRVLLVWDNFESVREMPDPTGATPPLDEAGGAALKGFLEWVRDHSSSAVIITSRAQEKWLGQVRRINVGGLNRAEAAEYAGHLLAPYPAARERRERRSFGELLDWLNGHPLAMRLILPRLDTTDPADLLAGLRGTIPLLTEDTGQDRLSSLGACITYSFGHLAEQTRRLLPAVSLLHGIADENLLMLFSADKRVPDRFAGVSTQEWRAVLEDAVRVGLLTGLGDVYRIHPALPGYLAAGWHAGDPADYAPQREACERALCTACADLSEWLIRQIESGNAAVAYIVIGLHCRTFGAMLGHAIDRHAWGDAERIVRALEAYWGTRGLDKEAEAWADRILDATAGSGQTPRGSARSLWLYIIVRQAIRQQKAGKPDQAAQTYQYALAHLQDQPETKRTRINISAIYQGLGNTAVRRGRLDEAEDWYRKSLAIKEQLGDRPSMAGTYHQLGIAAQEGGRLDEAEDWYRKALTITEQLGDRPSMAGTYHQLGVTAHLRGRLDEAEDWHRKSLAIKEQLGDLPRLAMTYHELGMTARDGGRLDEAEDWYRKALTITEQLGDRPSMAMTYHELGITAHLRGRLDEAEDWHRKALTITEQLGDLLRLAMTYHELGLTARDGGRLDEAEDWYRKSLTIKEQLGYRRGMALTYAQLGQLAEDQTQALLALAWNIRCVALFDQFPSPLTGPGPIALARLTRQLGMPALQAAWQQITGQPVPQAVCDYITRHHDQGPPGGTL